MSTTLVGAAVNAEFVTTHNLLNCYLREVALPAGDARLDDDQLRVTLRKQRIELRIQVRRASAIGAHRFLGLALRDGKPLTALQLGALLADELALATGTENEEFLGQLADSLAVITAGGTPPTAAIDRYLESEQALVLGHRFHPTPKSRSGDLTDWRKYAPEEHRSFQAHYLAVRKESLASGSVGPDVFFDVPVETPAGYELLPIHPWQYDMLSGNETLRAALTDGRVIDLGHAGPFLDPTSSVRTVHGPNGFWKFSLNVRITNCVRKNSAYELTGAPALTAILDEVLAPWLAAHPQLTLLREPAFRTLDLGDPELFEGFGVIARENLAPHDGVTPLLAAAVADEYPHSAAQISRLLAGWTPPELERWWATYLTLLMPPILDAFFSYGVVFEPHLQNVVIGVDADQMPAHVFLRDLEGTKLLPEFHQETLARLDKRTATAMTYDRGRGWRRIAYCLIVNHVSDLLSALADMAPELEARLWDLVAEQLRDFSPQPELRALLSGEPLPAKANLLTRWSRHADRTAGYVPLHTPWSRP
jgi:siderophore synthetase component